MNAGALLVAGDVGGTKTNLGLFRFEPVARDPGAGASPPGGQGSDVNQPGGPPAEAIQGGGRLQLLRGAQYASAEFPGLPTLLAAFLAEHASGAEKREVRAACFGVPGPVVRDFVHTPNLVWDVDCREVSQEVGIPVVRLVNDLVATAEGIPLLAPGDLAVLQEGNSAAGGNQALIAAGTGLGMSLLPWTGTGWAPVASEGGHMDFAPRNPEEWDLLGFLRGRLGGRVSVERVVSGPGLVQIYEHLRGPEAAPPDLPGFDDDPARAVSEAGLAGACGICAEALRRFAAAYGAVAGNLALVGTATGGVFLGGGIAPKILPKLQDGTFLEAFRDKGRFRGYMEALPVRVILDDRIAMFGAARLAAALLG